MVQMLFVRVDVLLLPVYFIKSGEISPNTSRQAIFKTTALEAITATFSAIPILSKGKVRGDSLFANFVRSLRNGFALSVPLLT